MNMQKTIPNEKKYYKTVYFNVMKVVSKFAANIDFSIVSALENGCETGNISWKRIL